jgi:hypothetical protein
MKLTSRFGLALLAAGLSAASGWAEDRIFSGTTALDKDTYFKYGTITFQDGATIVSNGHRLTLEGTKKIRFNGTPTLVSYATTLTALSANPGATGRSGGPILIKTPNLEGTTLTVRNIGTSGKKGDNGAPGPKGAKGTQGTQRDWNPWNGCIGGSDGKPGGAGGDGGDGGAGGNGGGGGLVLLDIRAGVCNGAVSRLSIDAAGGGGGAGGDAGAAGPGGDGGEGAPGTAYCNGTSPGTAGPPGRPGRTGPAGGDGNPGPVIDMNNIVWPCLQSHP